MLDFDLGRSLPLLLDVALKSLAVSAAALAVLPLLRRASASTRHLVLLAGLGVLLGLPALMPLLPRQELPRPVAVPRAALDAGPIPILPMPTAPPVSASSATPLAAAPVASLPPLPPPPADTPAAPPLVRAPWLVLGWLLGVLACAGGMLTAQARVWRLTRRCPPLPPSLLPQAEAGAFAARKTGPAGTPPMVWGWPRPALLLPPEAAAWPAARLRAVLRHEAAHVRRGDWLTQALAQAACALYWFNPLVWLLAARLGAEAERACDDAVLLSGVPPTDYAQDLLAVARQLGAGRPASSGAIAMARRSPVRGRLESILDARRPRRRATRRSALLALAAALSLAAPLAALRPAARADAPAATPPAPPAGVPTEADIAKVQQRLQGLEQAQAHYAAAHPNTLTPAQNALVDRLLEAFEDKCRQEDFDAQEAADNKRLRAEAKKPHTREEREQIWGPIFAYEHTPLSVIKRQHTENLRLAQSVIKRQHTENLRLAQLEREVDSLPAAQRVREGRMHAFGGQVALDKTQIEMMQMERAEGYPLHISQGDLATHARMGLQIEERSEGSRADWVFTELLNSKLNQVKHLDDRDVDALTALLREPPTTPNVAPVIAMSLFRKMRDKGMRAVPPSQQRQIREALTLYLTSHDPSPLLDKLEHKFAKKVLDLYGGSAPTPTGSTPPKAAGQDAAKNALRMQIIQLEKSTAAMDRQGKTLRTPAVVAFDRERHRREEQADTDMDQIRSADAKSVLYPAQAAHWKQVSANAAARLRLRQPEIQAMRPPTREAAAEVARYDSYQKAVYAAIRRFIQLRAAWQDKYALPRPAQADRPGSAM